ncbi:MAG: hypothetical protein M0Z87_09425 [Actinomycetota bacterium]|nr:hypothetical protein [Actinomycetota bacterium]
MRKALLTASSAAVALGGLGALVVAEGGGQTTPVRATTVAAVSPSAKAATKAHAKHRRHHPLLSRAIHATVEVRYHHGWRTLEFDHGKITAVSGTPTTGGTLTLVRPDGVTVQTKLSPSTHFAGTAPANLTAGERVRIKETGGTALSVWAHAPRAAKHAAKAPSSAGGTQASTGASAS